MVAEVIPFPRKVAHAAPPSRSRLTDLSGIGPERLTRILRDAGRGDIRDWANLCDRMVQQDAEIRADYVTRLAAVGAARWEIEPGPPTGDPVRDAYAAAAARFVADRMKALDNLSTFVMELLDGVGVGIAVSELDWAWTGSFFELTGLRSIHQRRLCYGEEWEPRIVELTPGQRVAGGLPLTNWPGKFVVHQPREHATDPGAAGVLRACAWPYLFKRWAVQFWVQGAERFAWPIAFGQVPRKTPEAAREQFRQQLERMTVDHSIVADEGNAVKLIESTVKDAGTWRELVKMLNAEFGKAILGSVDQSAPAEVGAWKAVESRKATTVDSRQAMDEKQFAATWRRDVVTWFIRYNTHLFGGVVPPIPVMRWVIAEDRREIPTHYFGKGIVTRNQALEAIGRDPISGPAGEEYV